MINEKCYVYERYENTPSDIAERIFFYPQWSGRFVCKQDFRIERSGFKSILILHTKNGSGMLHYRGDTVKLEKGSFAVINCLDEHIYYPNCEWEFEFLHFDGCRAKEFYDHICSLCGQFVFDKNEKLSQKFTAALSFCREKNVANEAAISKCISDILYHFLLDAQKNRPHRFDEVCEYIDRNIQADLSAGSIADHFGFSRSYFSTVFRKSTGTTVSEFLMSCRLNKAKKLMAHSSLSVAIISELVGFKDTTTFIRAFKRKEGMTPLKYKRTVLG